MANVGAGAGLVGGRPRDEDPRRLKRLRANCQTAGAGDIVEAKCEDFLALDPTSPQFAAVRAVLLDPSCSGGAHNRPCTTSGSVDPSTAWRLKIVQGPARFQSSWSKNSYTLSRMSE